MTDVSVLDRELYTEAEAARLLRLAPSTLHYWLEGGRYGERTYPPVVRPQVKGSPLVTWAEFVEAALLREYRRTLRVPMSELRAFIDVLRREYRVPYPLADRRPLVLGRELVLQAQDVAGLDAQFCLVATVRGQLVLTAAAENFLERVTWSGDLPLAWRPHEDPDSPVTLRPDVRFGRPMVSGISTAVLSEQDQSGASEDEIAEAFNLPIADVRWALAYEAEAAARAA